MTLETDRLLNANLHFRTEVVQVGGPVRYLYIQPEGDRDKALVDEYRWESWSRAGRYRHKETGRQIRNWTQYDVTQTEVPHASRRERARADPRGRQPHAARQ